MWLQREVSSSAAAARNTCVICVVGEGYTSSSVGKICNLG